MPPACALVTLGAGDAVSDAAGRLLYVPAPDYFNCAASEDAVEDADGCVPTSPTPTGPGEPEPTPDEPTPNERTPNEPTPNEGEGEAARPPASASTNAGMHRGGGAPSVGRADAFRFCVVAVLGSNPNPEPIP